MPTKSLTSQERLERSLDRLAKVAGDLPKSFGGSRHPLQHLFYSFCKGMAYGFGALVAVAIVVPFVISIMRSINWVPIVGNFVSEIATQMEQVRGSVPR